MNMSNKEIYLVVNINQQIGERQVNFKAHTMSLDGSIDSALNALNRELFLEYGDGGEYKNRKIADEQATQEWAQGFWLWHGESIMKINGYLQIGYESYLVAEEIL